jgi:hypothetical protein
MIFELNRALFRGANHASIVAGISATGTLEFAQSIPIGDPGEFRLIICEALQRRSPRGKSAIH